jgi:pilus assembly protein CpaB
VKTKLIAIAVALLLGAVGTVVVLRYVNTADERALAGTETVDVLMVAAPIPAGTPAEEVAAMVETRAVPAVAAVPERVTDLTQLTGQRSAVDLVAGEQLLPSQFSASSEAADSHSVEFSPDFVQVTVLLDSPRALGGALRPGDTVSAFLSFGTEFGSPPTTHLTVSHAMVTAVKGAGSTAEPPAEAETSAAPAAQAGTVTEPPAVAPGVQLYVTLAAQAADAESIVFAAEYGTIWLGRDSADIDLNGTRIVVPDNVYAPDTIGATP